MATPATRPAPTPSAATPGPASSRPRDLSGLRNGDAGSAFRGITKGRDGNPDRGGGRGGNRHSRGGRGPNGPSRARAGTEPNTPKAEPSPLKVEVPVETKPAAGAAASSSPSAEKPAAAPAAGAKLPKAKVPSRRGSRNVPAVAVAPPSPTVEATPPSATRPKNPRQRSTQGKAAANPVRQTLSIDAAMSQSSLRPQKARTGPPTPTIVKDVPPHLTSASAAPEVTTFDMKHDIDALVEHMRSAAMSDSLRPSTPGSHIDWAGDDDDSLPDLNDWGVTTSYSKTAVEMSPILVDNLKPLPEAVTRIKIEAAADSPAATPTEQNPSLQATSVPAPPAVSPQSVKVTLHPSLPARPAAALPKFAEKPKAKAVPVPVRAAVPLAQSAVQADKPAAQVEPPAATAEKVPQVPVVKLPTSTASENTITIADAEPAEDTEFAVEKSTKNTSLSASMHAPSPLSDSSSLPTLSTSNPLTTAPPTGPRSFTPTHQRAHTVGRSHPTSPPANQRFPRAPRGGFHNRTHSSPPAGPDSNPRVHSRPVLTNDALSRLMKTVVSGNNPIKAREVVAATE